MVISMCEEVQHPATQVPKAMVMTIVINTVGGLLFLVPLMFVLPDLAMLVALPSGQPVPTIIKSAVGSSGGAIALLIPLMVLAILCGVACTTAASRCTWAFARDGAIPGSKLWKQVHPTLDLPFIAMMLSMAIQIVLGVIYFGSTTAFNAFSGVGVISLTVSYAAPIAVSMYEGRTQVKGAKFSLGKLGWLCNSIALGTSCFPTSLAFRDAPANCRRQQNSLVRPCRSPFLHACLPSRHRCDRQLCPGCVCRFCCHCRCLVRCMGPQELPWPADRTIY
jgi:amino acid transporter